MDMTGKTVAESLREATHEVHKALEHLPIAAALAEGRIALADYRTYLQRLLVVIREVETQTADPRAAVADAADWSDGCRLRWISEDLTALGAEIPPPAMASASPLPSAASMWGRLYVIEGSTLGGVILARGLANRDDLRPALRYLNGYGAATGERWRRFRAALASNVSPAGIPEAAAAAGDMFARFGREVMT
jgi:heme oxygenase